MKELCRYIPVLFGLLWAGITPLSAQQGYRLGNPFFTAKIDSPPFGLHAIELADEDLEEIANSLAILSCAIEIPNRVRAQMVSTGLALTPGTERFETINADLGREQVSKAPPFKGELDTIARRLVAQTEKIHGTWLEKGGKDRELLLTMLLDICFAMYPEDPEITYTHDMFSRDRSATVNWGNLLKEVNRRPDSRPLQVGEGLLLSRSQTGINGLLIREIGMNMAGKASRMSATYLPRRDKFDGHRLGFNQEVGELMAGTLPNIAEFMGERHGKWISVGDIEIAFQDKFVLKDGDSAGLACGLMMESLVTGTDLDPGFTCTGALGKDGSVNAIGGVIAKLRGAQKYGSSIVVVPRENEAALSDMVLLGEASDLAKMQVFVVDEFDQAWELAQRSRSADIQASIDEFATLQSQFTRGDVLSVLRAPGAKEKLERILKRTPNHASARLMKLYVSGGMEPRMSFNGSVEALVRELGIMSECFYLEDLGGTFPSVRIDTRFNLEDMARYSQRLKFLASRINQKSTPLAKKIWEFYVVLNYKFGYAAGKGSQMGDGKWASQPNHTLEKIFKELDRISDDPEIFEDVDSEDLIKSGIEEGEKTE